VCAASVPAPARISLSQTMWLQHAASTRPKVFPHSRRFLRWIRRDSGAARAGPGKDNDRNSAIAFDSMKELFHPDYSTKARILKEIRLEPVNFECIFEAGAQGE